MILVHIENIPTFMYVFCIFKKIYIITSSVFLASDAKGFLNTSSRRLT